MKTLRWCLSGARWSKPQSRQRPKSIACRAGSRRRDFTLELGSLVFQPGAGAPNATDLERGRRPATGQDYLEFLKLTHHFDVFQMISPQVEPQDVPTHLRHYFTTQAQMELTDKFPFFFSRGTPQVMDCFEMLTTARGLSDDAFRGNAHCYTIINTNSPRTLDIPMAQGLIDFARHGQMSIITPFTLMGAMAPITVAGAITLSHAEALGRADFDPTCQSRRSGLLWHVHQQCGHEIRRARFWDAVAFSGVAGGGATGAASGFAVAVGCRVGVEHQRCAGRKREPVRPVGLP